MLYLQALEPFTTNSWSWSNNNMVKLQEELSREDKAVFGFDIKTDFDWKEYLETYVQVSILLLIMGLGKSKHVSKIRQSML